MNESVSEAITIPEVSVPHKRILITRRQSMWFPCVFKARLVTIMYCNKLFKTYNWLPDFFTGPFWAMVSCEKMRSCKENPQTLGELLWYILEWWFLGSYYSIENIAQTGSSFLFVSFILTWEGRNLMHKRIFKGVLISAFKVMFMAREMLRKHASGFHGPT